MHVPTLFSFNTVMPTRHFQLIVTSGLLFGRQLYTAGRFWYIRVNIDSPLVFSLGIHLLLSFLSTEQSLSEEKIERQLNYWVKSCATLETCLLSWRLVARFFPATFSLISCVNIEKRLQHINKYIMMDLNGRRRFPSGCL